jgi:hypothetical protein
MDHVNFSLILVLILSVLCALSILLIVLVKKENKLLSQQLTETTISLELSRNKMAALQEKHSQINEFQSSLHVAELTTRLQKPRLDAQSIDRGNSVPGKYSSIQSLAQKGMSAEEIASIHAISTQEARQLVNLSKLAR